MSCFTLNSSEAIERKDVIERMKKLRPSDLVILIRKPDLGGEYVLGMYSVEKDELDPDLRRFKLWQESFDDLNIYSETVRCSPDEPIRVKRDATSIYVRRLNPGGEVTKVNQEDHLVWWAACEPGLAGADPTTLRQAALARGYTTGLVEYQEVLRAPRRR